MAAPPFHWDRGLQGERERFESYTLEFERVKKTVARFVARTTKKGVSGLTPLAEYLFAWLDFIANRISTSLLLRELGPLRLIMDSLQFVPLIVVGPEFAGTQSRTRSLHWIDRFC